MNNMTKKLLSFMFALVLAFALASCGLFKSVTKEEAKANLEAAGYTVTVIEGSVYAESEDNEFMLTAGELETYMYAVKGEDKIKMFFFYTVNQASINSEFMNNFDGLLSGQANELVYFGTRQAIKDAGL